MSETPEMTIARLQQNEIRLIKELQAMRVGREADDLAWRKKWEQEKRRADEAYAALRALPTGSKDHG